MKRTAISLACILALVSTSLSALGAPRSAAAVSAHAPSALKGTLTVFDWGAFEVTAGTKKLLAEYRRMHPGVTLKILPMPPGGDPTVWEENVLAAGEAPDLIVPSYTMQVFSDLPKHQWLDLTPYLYQPDPYIKGNRRWIDSMNPTMNQQNAFEGKYYYVISWQAQDAAFFYNKDMFKKAGISGAPTTWAEFMADCAKLKKAGFTPVYFPAHDTYPIAMNGSIVSLLEGQVMGKTFQHLDTNHDGVVDIKELVYGIKHKIYSPMNSDYQEAWKLLKDWSQYWEPNPVGAKVDTFITGKAAIDYNGEWTGVSTLPTDKVKFPWGVFKMPEVTKATTPLATPNNRVGIWGAWNADAWSIPVTTKTRGHLALALDFLHWITTPQVEVPVDLANGPLPTVADFHPTGWYNLFFYDLLTHPTMQFPAEATLGYEWLRNRIAMQQAYITGMQSLDQTMAQMQRFTDDAASRIAKIYHLSY